MRGFALAAALVAAAFLPGERLGLAVPIVAALMVLAARAGLRVSLLRLVFGLLACALAAQAALLDAGWVVCLDLVAAWVLACLAAAGPALAAIVAPVRALGLVPAVTPRPSTRWAPVLRGSALGGFVLLPFGWLFLSADAAFAGLAGDLPLPSGGSLPGRIATLVLILSAALGLGLATRLRGEPGEPRTLRRLSRAEWMIPLALLDALFLAFVIVQLTVLFGGHDRVLRTTGLTYAEYARSGFWQLLAVAAMTFAVIGAVWTLATVRTPRDGVIVRVLLGALVCLTLVIVVSAFHRLRLYEDAFGLTRLRLLTETTALWLGCMLVLVGAAGALAAVRARLAPAAVLAHDSRSARILGGKPRSPDRRAQHRPLGGDCGDRRVLPRGPERGRGARAGRASHARALVDDPRHARSSSATAIPGAPRTSHACARGSCSACPGASGLRGRAGRRAERRQGALNTHVRVVLPQLRGSARALSGGRVHPSAVEVGES